ncbi:MAG: PDZ domain-containing protein, partial [Phycisphaerales bacterium]
TTDGGETWEKILYVDDKTGVVDLRMNPKDPETLVVATYERQRDGYDSNTPKKPWGPGSAIYRTTDGGKTFTKSTEGLPTCELGRIGLDYYRADPNIVYAIVESQHSGQEPENAPFIGVRGEDVEVGARITQITDESPAAEAGLKVGDIVVAIEDTTIHSYGEMDATIRGYAAGDTVLIEVSRDRKTETMELTFAQKPSQVEDSEESRRQQERGGRPGGLREQRPTFGTMLGGQRENVQDQQGKEGQEFGGLFRSDDGGVTWKRINSVNPRPMYFSKIRVDPSDNNHIYVLGVSLYRSKDGGETFTPDAGRGVHSDHHGMWIDPNDGRHIILTNDGGLYVTYDRCESWDHLNHFAIGQFYHVGLDTRPDYMVYGGLQDNGSWGGPARSRSGSGPINEDWIFVGGGDGFISRADPNDPEQLYFASQNGGLGKYHLGTGERGYVRARAPRGTRYRFNWKTPYILSNHNTGIYYFAGNFVFRSMFRGEDPRPISPEITTTDQGCATALAECPSDPDVLYVGTNEGTLWRTTNGGHEWVNLFDLPDEPAETEEEPEAEPAEQAGQAPPETAAEEPPAERPDRPRRGGRGGGGRMLEMLREADANNDGKIQKDEIPERMQRMFSRLDSNDDGVIDESEMNAMAERAGERPPRREAPPEQAQAEEVTETIEEKPAEAKPAEEKPAPAADPVTGIWNAQIIGEDIPQDQGKFAITLALDPNGNITGHIKSELGEGDIADAAFDPETSKLTFTYAPEHLEMALGFDATVAGSRLTGTIAWGDTEMTMSFEADRTDVAEPEQQPAEEKPAAETPAAEEKPAPPADPLSGRWDAKIIGEDIPPGEGQFTITLTLAPDGKLTGRIESQIGEGDISEGLYNAEKKELTFTYEAAEMGMALDFTAALVGPRLTGSIEMGGSGMSMSFEADRVAAPPTIAAAKLTAAPGAAPAAPPVAAGQSIDTLLPGPRWVSAIEPSRHKPGRVYVTFDGHRSNDDEPYIFASEDYGKTWRSIRANLPTSAGSTRVIREDITNGNILYLGAEFSAWVSVDRGGSWTKLNSNLPTVAVHEFAQHPTSGELVAATHGRSLWILDVTPLRQMSAGSISEKAHLYVPNKVTYWRSDPRRGGTNRRFVGENAPDGVTVFYSLSADSRRVSLKITDMRGELVRELEADGSSGLHLATWDCRREPPEGRGGARSRGGEGGRRYYRRGPRVEPGKYLVVLTVDNQTITQELLIQGDPVYPNVALWGEEYDAQQEATGIFED